MADCENALENTCEVSEEKLSDNSTETAENIGSLKRSLQDDSNAEDDTLVKRVKTEELENDEEAKNNREKKRSFVPRKKKCALLLCYCGAGYNGMQINPGVRTIEEELVNALFKAEAITEDGKACLGKMSFQRCARTDKGVSAARQIVSLKMIPEQSIVPKINEHLPPEIRVIAMKRTTRGFDAKGNCSARTYEYLTPTYSFAKDYQTTTNYRVTEEKIEEVNQVLSKFLGTHSYHNFTSGKRFDDASAKRYIMKFKCGKPFEKDGREFITISVKGQSFMLHQIRKMIGLALAIVRGVAPLSTIELARMEKKVDIPKAPAVGLVLDEVHFEAYNRRYGDDGIHESLEWDENEEEIQQFKDQYIYKQIIDTDVREGVMLKWLRTLPDHSYTHERMEEIHYKADDNSATQETSAKTNETTDSDKYSCLGGSSDTKQVTKGGESDENEQVEKSDVSEDVEQGK